MRGGGRGGGTWEGETKRGWTESEQGEGASETGKVDPKEKESEKLRESVEKRRAEKGKGSEPAQKHSSHNCSDPGWEKEVQPQHEKQNPEILFFFFFSFFSGRRNLKIPRRGKRTGRKEF